MRLCLQPDTHVLDRRRQHGVSDARERAGNVVLAVAELLGLAVGFPALLEPAARGVECAELDGDAGTDAQEGG